MPAALSSLSDFETSAIGSQLQPYWVSMPPGAVAQALYEASEDANRICRRRLTTPTATTVATTTSPGALSVPVASALNIYPLDVAAFATGEVIEVQGADVTAITSEGAAGTITLSTPTTATHNAGEHIQFYRQEQVFIRGRKTDPLDQETSMSQQGQIAMAHAPRLGLGQFSRTVMVTEYPLWSVFAAFQTLPWTGSASEVKADLSNATIERSGYIRLPIGFPNFQPGSIWRVQYLAGLSIIPYDLRDAVHLLMAARLMRSQNPMGATTLRVDDQSYTAPGQQYITEAQCILKTGRYIRKTV